MAIAFEVRLPWHNALSENTTDFVFIVLQTRHELHVRGDLFLLSNGLNLLYFLSDLG
jgi:hypothetical protein